MGKHPFVDDWNKEEAKVSKELTKNLNKSLNATKVLAEIDKKFPDPASGSKPPKGVADSFDTYAEISIKLQKSSYPGMDVTVSLTFSIVKKKWRASGTAQAVYRKRKVSASNYVIQPGDTLFNIAQKHYGEGGYYPAIAEANPKTVGLKGNFIVAHSQIKLPALDVLEKDASSKVVIAARKGNEGQKTGKEVQYPLVNLNLTKNLVERTVSKRIGDCMVFFDVALTGNITAETPGAISSKFIERDFTQEVEKKMLKNLSAKIAFDPKNPKMTVSTTYSGSLGSATYSMDSMMTGKASFSSKPFKKKIGDTTYTGTMGAEVTIRFACIPREMPQAVLARAGYRDATNELNEKLIATIALAGAIIVIGAFVAAGGGAVIVAAVKETSIVVSYGAAQAAGGGMVLSGI